jgi:hypothetical protein
MDGNSHKEALISTELLLFDLGVLQTAMIVSRPSALIKSPYIADIMTMADSQGALPPELSNFKAASSRAGQRALDAARVDGLRSYAGTTHLAHAPALDCAGMVVPGAIVHCSANDPRRKVKTAFTIQLCEELREDGVRVLVGYNPASAEAACAALLQRGLLQDELGEYDAESVLRQQTFGTSRIDFVLSHADGSITLLEVKNVVSARAAPRPPPYSCSGEERGRGRGNVRRRACGEFGALPGRRAGLPGGPDYPAGR